MSDQPIVTPGNGRYRLKSATVEAQQWFEGADIPEVIRYQPPDAVIGGWGHGSQRFPQEPYWAVVDATGPTEVRSGDWILIDRDGHVSVCDPDSFLEYYERVEDSAVPVSTRGSSGQ